MGCRTFEAILTRASLAIVLTAGNVNNCRTVSAQVPPPAAGRPRRQPDRMIERAIMLVGGR